MTERPSNADAPSVAAAPAWGAGRPPSPPRPLARAGLCLLALATFELVARVSLGWPSFVADKRYDTELGVAPPRDRDFVLSDARGTFEHRLGLEGFRSRPLPTSTHTVAPDPTRLLVLGDSYVNAWRVRRDERFVEVAEAKFDGAIEAFCVCSDGWGPQQMLLAYERYRARIGAGRVVIATYPANDVLNASPEFCGTVAASVGDYVRPYLVPRADGTLEPWSPHPVRAWLRRTSVTAARLENALLGQEYIDAFPLRALHPERDVAHRGALEPAISSERWERGFELYADVLAAFVRRVRADGAEPLVLVIPKADQVRHGASLAIRDFTARAAGEVAPSSVSDFERPERILAPLFAARDVPVVFALDALRTAASDASAGLFLDDGHLDHEGHAVVGGLLATWVRGGATHATFDADLVPVDLLPQGVDGLRWLDLARPRPIAVERGLVWSSAITDGARLGRDGVRLVLQMDPSAIEVRGRVAARTPLPVELEVFGAGAPLGRLRIETAGAFHGRLANPGAALVAGLPRAVRPYAPIEIRRAGDASARAMAGAVVLTAVGFVDARPDASSGARRATGTAATFVPFELPVTSPPR